MLPLFLLAPNQLVNAKQQCRRLNLEGNFAILFRIGHIWMEIALLMFLQYIMKGVANGSSPYGMAKAAITQFTRRWQ
jgi:hypothetical protein